MKTLMTAGARLVRSIRLARARHREVSRTIQELSGSSDRALMDIGIARGDIVAIARRARS